MQDDAPSLVDTNVLVYSLYEDEPRHAACAALLARCQRGDAPLCLFPQVLAELFAVITNRRRVTSVYSPQEAVDVIRDFTAMRGLTVLPLPDDIVSRWLKLVEETPVVGAVIFDVQIVAAMESVGVRRIYTYNSADFERFDEIEVLEP